MSRIGDKFDMEPPTPEDTSPRNWAAEVNEILQELIDRTENKVEPNHINVIQPLVMNGNDLTEASGIHFQPRVLSGASDDALFYASDDGEFYFQDGASNQVPLTSNGLTNVSSTGIISGDAADATIRYDDATTTFSFVHRVDGNFGTFRARELEIANDDEIYFATLDYIGGAANRTYTLSGSLPASTTFMTMTTGGVIGHEEDSVPPLLTTTSTVTCTTADYTTERWRVVPIRANNTHALGNFTYTSPSGAGTTVGYILSGSGGTSTGWALIDINDFLDDGDIITGWSVPIKKVSGAPGDITCKGSVCTFNVDGSITVPGSLAESSTITFGSGGPLYYQLTYSGVSTLTVDRNGAGTSSDIARKYAFMFEIPSAVTSAIRHISYIMLKVKRG